jgi:hypothetical protein
MKLYITTLVVFSSEKEMASFVQFGTPVSLSLSLSLSLSQFLTRDTLEQSPAKKFMPFGII